jgi:hypothetical protein
MTITGVFIGGPANMISAAITADLGRQEILAASDKALSTVTGIVDGTGSFGAAIGQILIPVIQEAWDDWRFVFYFFVLMVRFQIITIENLKIIYIFCFSSFNFKTFITCLCILPLFIRECKIAFNKIKTRFSTGSQTNYDTLE